MAEYTPRAAESTHWYRRDGTPAYEVPDATGKRMIVPDVRHARKLDLLPSVTGVMSCADKPGLTIWRIEQSILASLTLPRRPHEPDAEFIRRVIDDAQEQGKKAAQVGEEIHAAVQGHYEGRQAPPQYLPHVQGAASEIEKMFGAAGWECETSFGCALGFGGKIDLLRESDRALGDIKSKDFSEPPTPQKKLHWDENAIQLAAYKMGKYGDLEGPAFNVYVSRTVPGLTHLHVWEKDDIARGWEQFKALHAYWCATKRYQPGWQP